MGARGTSAVSARPPPPARRSGLSLALCRAHARAHPGRAARSEARRPADRRSKSIMAAFPSPATSSRRADSPPSRLEVNNPAWLENLHGFRWLRHMRAAGTELAAANARALVADWIAAHGRDLRPRLGPGRHVAPHHRLAAAFVRRAARRRIPVLSLLPEVAGRADPLSARRWRRKCPTARSELRARIALAFAALSLPAPASALRTAARNLAERTRTADPAGWRPHLAQPAAMLELLADLLPLRQTFANQAEAPPPALMGAIDRMLPALRFFRHQDGSARPLQRHRRDHPRPHRRHPAP